MDTTVNPELNAEAAVDGGTVNISDEVVAVIASMAANEVEGIASMVSGVAGGFAELLGMKNLSKGVRTVRDGNTVSIYLSVIVEYGAKIPDISWQLQNKVKNDVEAMTGLEVKSVNLSVEGISVADYEPQAKPEPQAEPETKPEPETSPEAETDADVGADLKSNTADGE